MARFSSAHLESISLSLSPWPLHISSSITSHPSSTFRRSSALGEWGWFSPCVLMCTLLCLYLCFTKSVALFLKLSLSIYTFLSLSLLFITHTVKSDRMDKCGSMVKQIPEAPQRAKINHFSSSLSSTISFPLCLHSSPFFNLSALLLAASSSSSLSFECHSTLPSYSNILLLIKNQVPSLSKTYALPPPFFSWKAQMPTPLPSISSICGVRLLEPRKTFWLTAAGLSKTGKSGKNRTGKQKVK